MNKASLKLKLIELQKILIDDLREKIDTDQTMVDIDESDTIDPEDLSHQTESMEIQLLMKQQIDRAIIENQNLLKIDFSEKTSVITGALVSTDFINFFIGHSTIPFDFEQNKVIGISTESPIYNELKGKKVGDKFTISENKYTILEIN